MFFLGLGLSLREEPQADSMIPRQSLPPHFEPIYNQLQAQYEKDSMRDEHHAYTCHNCKFKFYKSMYVEDKSDADYAKYVLFKQAAKSTNEDSVGDNDNINNNSTNATPRNSNNNNSNNSNSQNNNKFANSSNDSTPVINETNGQNAKSFLKLADSQSNKSTDSNPSNKRKVKISSKSIKSKSDTSSSIVLQFCPQCGNELVKSSVKMAINLKSAMVLTAEKQKEEFRKVGKSGVLHKQGATFHRWVQRYYVIKEKFLYSFQKQADETPSNVIFISGWFITAHDDEHLKKGYYGIELQPPHSGDQPKDLGNHSNSSLSNEIPNGTGAGGAAGGGANGTGASGSMSPHAGGNGSERLQAKMLYAKSASDRKDWVTALQAAASTLAIQNYYNIGKVIGKGHFSVVHFGTHKKTNKKYAIKVVEKKRIDAREKMALRNEIAIMKLVNHPCIIKMEDVYEDKKCIYMVMQLVEYGDFFGRWQSKKNFKEDTIRIIVWKMLDALHYLHNLGIVHRDLKPENILCTDEFDDTQLLISDFGLSKFAAPNTEMNMSCGTLAYVAPEVLKQKGYSWKVDLWSLGCIMHLLIRNVLPFDGRTKEQVIERTLNKKLDLVTKPIWKEISAEAKDLLSKLLEKDPKERIDLQSAMDHAWFDAIRHDSKYILHHKVSADLIALTKAKSMPNSPEHSANISAAIMEPKAKTNLGPNNANNTNDISIANSGTSDADDKFVWFDDALKRKQ